MVTLGRESSRLRIRTRIALRTFVKNLGNASGGLRNAAQGGKTELSMVASRKTKPRVILSQRQSESKPGPRLRQLLRHGELKGAPKPGATILREIHFYQQHLCPNIHMQPQSCPFR
jgi:hypothetical protein